MTMSASVRGIARTNQIETARIANAQDRHLMIDRAFELPEFAQLGYVRFDVVAAIGSERCLAVLPARQLTRSSEVLAAVEDDGERLGQRDAVIDLDLVGVDRHAQRIDAHDRAERQVERLFRFERLRRLDGEVDRPVAIDCQG